MSVNIDLPEPNPEEKDQQVLPHDPEKDDFLAELLRAPDQAEVRQQADDGSNKRGPYIFIKIILELDVNL